MSVSAENSSVGPFDPRIDEVKVVEVIEDPASGGNKVAVVLELPLIAGSKQGSSGLEQLFNTDKVKRLAIREAGKVFNRVAGWSDIGRLLYFKDGEPVNPRESEPDAVRVTIKCTAQL